MNKHRGMGSNKHMGTDKYLGMNNHLRPSNRKDMSKPGKDSSRIRRQDNPIPLIHVRAVSRCIDLYDGFIEL